MPKLKVFVTRIIPEAGLAKLRDLCDADVWREPLPPTADVLRERVAPCDGLVSLLTDRIDAALLDAAPRLKVVSNYAVGFNNVDVPAATARGVCVGNTPGVLTDATADMAFCLLIAAARRVVESQRYSAIGPVEDLGAARPSRPGPGRPHARRRRHGPHRLRPGQARASAAGTCRSSITIRTQREGRDELAAATSIRRAAARVGLHLGPHRPERADAGPVQRGGLSQDEADGRVREHGSRPARGRSRSEQRRCARA